MQIGDSASFPLLIKKFGGPQLHLPIHACSNVVTTPPPPPEISLDSVQRASRERETLVSLFTIERHGVILNFPISSPMLF